MDVQDRDNFPNKVGGLAGHKETNIVILYRFQ